MIFLFSTIAHANPFITAAEVEMSRAVDQLSLPEQPTPHWIGMELFEGQYSLATSKNGALFSSYQGDMQSACIEVRVGTATFDSGNFNASGQRGVVYKSLPTEDDELALRQELWLGIDKAYKSAVEAYSEKQATFDGRDYPLDIELLPAEVQKTDFYPPSLSEDWTVSFSNQLSSVFTEFDFLEENTVLVYSENAAKHYLNTEGFFTSQPKTEVLIRVVLSARAEDGAVNRSTRSWALKNKESLASIEEYKAELREMALWLQDLHSAPIEEDYLGPVLFEKDASVELFRQLLQPQLSATPPLIEMPDFNGELPVLLPSSRIGRRLLPEGWSVVDDVPSNPSELGFYAFDDQGIPPQRIQLVKDGVVTDLLMSRIPRKGFEQSTGHGRSIGRTPLFAFPGVVNITPKRRASRKKMQRKALKMAKQTGLDYVLVIKRIEPLSQTETFEVAISGSEQLSGLTLPTEVYRLYEDGRKEPVRGLSFVGAERKVLRDIVLAGEQSGYVGLMDDSRGRYGIGPFNGMGVSWSAPAVLIGEMELRGQGGQELRVIPRAIPTR